MSYIHLPGDRCPSCEEKLKEVHPDLSKWFVETIKPRWPDAHVSCGWRGQIDQDKAFLEGKSKLKYPNSKHNKIKSDGSPCAQAIDLFQLRDGKAFFPPLWFAEIAHEGIGQLPITWGGTFKFVDGPHFEMK